MAYNKWMNNGFAVTLAIGMAIGAASAHAAAPPEPAKLGLCVACHGLTGRSTAPGTPHLGGQDETYLRRALLDYRSGNRTALPMNAIAGSLQARDIEQLAAWYAAQSGSGAL